MPSSGRSLRTSSMPPATCAERVDVEAGVGLVEHRDHRLEHRHLQDLVALLLAAREALVQVALLEAVVHAEALRPRHELHAHLEHGVVVDALAGGDRLAQEVEHRDAGDLLGVLEAEEEAQGGALLDRGVGDVGAAEQDAARRSPGRRGCRAACWRGSTCPSRWGPSGRGARRRHGQGHAAQDLVSLDGHVEVVDLERAGRRGGSATAPIVITLRP